MKRVIDAPDAAPTLFPEPDLDALLTYVRSVWYDLKSIGPVWWDNGRETVLVGGLFEALVNDERLMAHGVGFGKLFLEAPTVELDSQGMPRTKGRSDIVFAHASFMGPSLVLEFKRLNNAGHLRGEYVKEGIHRFVSGKYSPEADLGVMVGLVSGSVPTECSALLAYLSKPAVMAKINSKAISGAAYGLPSLNAPALDFDTLHDRPATCLAPEIRVGHMLLER